MGQAKQRKDRFFAQHPICCFCGGGAKATTQDHWPPRSFFLGRIWPDEHVFPACQRCNSASRIHEMLFAMICRIRFGPAKVGIPEDDGYAEWMKNAQGVARVLPDVYRSMHLSVTEKRSRMRQMGILPDPGRTTRDVPILSIDHPEFAEAAKTITRKLFCALYYFRTSRILGSGGGIVSFWTTNAHSMDEFLNAETLRPVLAQFPPIRRGGAQLGDQFSCAYTVAEVDPPSALFVVQFNDAVAMIGAAFGDISQCTAFEQVPEIANHQVFPYEWE
jgi:hypothetical protein